LLATGGCHINSNEFFQARELARRDAEIKALNDEKKRRLHVCNEQRAAVMLIRSKGDLTYDNVKLFSTKEIETLLKWKKAKPTAKRKTEMVDAYIKAPKPQITKSWTRSEEARLTELLKEDVPIKETALAVATTQMARAVTNNLANLDTPTRASLKRSLQDFEDEKGDNII
jgi:hypothetical protein